MRFATLILTVAVAQATPAVVTVYTVNDCMIPAPVAISAKALAGKMLSSAGISILWRSGKPRSPLPEHSVVLEVSGGTRNDYYPGALALAKPYEGDHIEVFYGRIAETVIPPTVPALLAHVLVHEITHVLQGINRHSDEGIMKAHWDAHDYQRMASKPLSFTDKDLELIRRGVVPVAN
jgi:hypothetical protein